MRPRSSEMWVWFVAGSLTACAAPVITVPPRPQHVPLGGTTTLWVAATGSGAVTYQWYRELDTEPIPGATNAYLVLPRAGRAEAGSYRVEVRDAEGLVWSPAAEVALFDAGVAPFGTVTLAPRFQLDGVGSNVDSIAFWEAADPTETRMFVTAKDSDLVEVWQHPFAGRELAPLRLATHVNGVAVDQVADRLYVSDRRVSVFSLPELAFVGEFGEGVLGVGENNLALYQPPGGPTSIYVTDDHVVHRFDAVTWTNTGAFPPPVTSIETVLADNVHQVLLVPEEQGPLGAAGVFAFHPDGTPFLRQGTNRFGQEAIFDSDEEGILLYAFPTDGAADNGAGFYVVTDQRLDQTDFECFDRETWSHLGTVRLEGVSNTDGIASTQRGLPEFPLGLFAAVNNDTTTAGLGWDVILQAMGVDLAPRVLSVTPERTDVTSADSLTMTVRFNQPVSGFDDAADVAIDHHGTRNAGLTVSGSGSTYTIQVTGLGGRGYFLAAVSTHSGVTGLASNALASSVTSVPVFVESPYRVWARDRGLTPGLNDAPTDDPDGDGRPNLVEFALDGDPLDNAEPVAHRAQVDDAPGDTRLIYTLPMREGAVFTGDPALSAVVDGIRYTLEGSSDLGTFDAPVREQVPARADGLPARRPGWSYRTFLLAPAQPGQRSGFIRLQLTETP